MKHVLFIIVICSVISCSKSGMGDSADLTKPVISIMAPVTSEQYSTGDPLCFKGNVIDDNSLKTVQLKLFRADNMHTPVIQYNYPVVGCFWIVEEKTILPASLNGNCVLQFEATDKYNNTAVATLNFSSN